MKVRVEMEMPCSCKECPFFYPGKEHDVCYFPEEKIRLFSHEVSDTDRPGRCPLDNCVRVVECRVTHHHTTTIDEPPIDSTRSRNDPFKYWNKASYKAALQHGIGIVPTEVLVRDAVPTRPYLFVTQKQYELDPEGWKARIAGLQAPESHLIIIPEFETLDNKLREEEEDEELRWMPRESDPLVHCPKCGASVDKYLGYQYRHCPMCGIRLYIPKEG